VKRAAQSGQGVEWVDGRGINVLVLNLILYSPFPGYRLLFPELNNSPPFPLSALRFTLYDFRFTL